MKVLIGKTVGMQLMYAGCKFCFIDGEQSDIILLVIFMLEDEMI